MDGCSFVGKKREISNQLSAVFNGNSLFYLIVTVVLFEPILNRDYKIIGCQFFLLSYFSAVREEHHTYEQNDIYRFIWIMVPMKCNNPLKNVNSEKENIVFRK